MSTTAATDAASAAAAAESESPPPQPAPAPAEDAAIVAGEAKQAIPIVVAVAAAAAAAAAAQDSDGESSTAASTTAAVPSTTTTTTTTATAAVVDSGKDKGKGKEKAAGKTKKQAARKRRKKQKRDADDEKQRRPRSTASQAAQVAWHAVPHKPRPGRIARGEKSWIEMRKRASFERPDGTTIQLSAMSYSMSYDRIVMAVFSFLGINDVMRCAQVSKSWRKFARLARSETITHLHLGPLWAKLGIDESEEFNTRFRAFVQQHKMVEHLSFEFCHGLTDEWLEFVTKTLSPKGGALQYLSLYYCYKITPVRLLEVLRREPQLDTLSIGRCSQLGDDFISKLTVVPNLRTIDLRYWRMSANAMLNLEVLVLGDGQEVKENDDDDDGDGDGDGDDDGDEDEGNGSDGNVDSEGDSGKDNDDEDDEEEDGDGNDDEDEDEDEDDGKGKGKAKGKAKGKDKGKSKSKSESESKSKSGASTASKITRINLLNCDIKPEALVTEFKAELPPHIIVLGPKPSVDLVHKKKLIH